MRFAGAEHEEVLSAVIAAAGPAIGDAGGDVEGAAELQKVSY
jgi:hypothetical protein